MARFKKDDILTFIGSNNRPYTCRMLTDNKLSGEGYGAVWGLSPNEDLFWKYRKLISVKREYCTYKSKFEVGDYVRKGNEYFYVTMVVLDFQEVISPRGMYYRLSKLNIPEAFGSGGYDDELELVNRHVGNECLLQIYWSGGIEDYKNNKNKKTIMSSIKEFAKNLILSADEKLLRKYYLKDENGNYTAEAFDIIKEKLTKDNETYLIEIATAKEAENKK